MKYNCYGKYRAIVTEVEKPLDINTRVKFKCPKVLGEGKSNWAYPCVPFQLYNPPVVNVLKYEIRPPKVGDAIWVEFEEGNLSKPIWVGTWKV
ncbi:MAG: phage baseplate assembly protein V [Peptostreptococcaceae bacterium]